MLSGFLGLFGRQTVISDQVKQWPDARRVLFHLIQSWSKALKDPEEIPVADVADLIRQFSEEFETIRKLGCEEGAKQGKCWPMKCDAINNVLEDVRLRLEEDPSQRFLMSQYLDMVARHFGRLTLQAYENTDVFAIRMDMMVDMEEERFRDERLKDDPEEAGREWRQLRAVSKRLCVAIKCCYCLQCGKRLVLNKELYQ
ncbi:uncharacterized protein N7483_000145 [Penicillium malachiteum]|uniref:uncharacterized protein n=1 Tax=Penicillium malachiteum TaxID=1324776 RepID=UPI0025497C09|nr:uncharacterized protein N7483_000145 [Penicillium malachiteum]KAJ5735020.1 hypothetical protein N7483_000145 [Penicillium malachiteum]